MKWLRGGQVTLSIGSPILTRKQRVSYGAYKVYRSKVPFSQVGSDPLYARRTPGM